MSRQDRRCRRRLFKGVVYSCAGSGMGGAFVAELSFGFRVDFQ